jgi:sigma-E factor negative regulatory protein RseC
MAELAQPGVVISNNGNMARVQMRCLGACSGQHEGCARNALIENIVKEEFVVEARNPFGAKPGYRVEVGISSKCLYKAVFLIYILPLGGLFVGLFLGLRIATLSGLSNYENLFGGMFMAVGVIISFLVTKKAGKSYNPGYTITRVLRSNVPSWAQGVHRCGGREARLEKKKE